MIKTKGELKKILIKGIGWLILKRIVIQIILTVSNIFLVRLLFPADFGKFAILQFIANFIFLFADIGLGRALVVKARKIDSSTLQSVWVVQTSLFFMVFLLAWFLSPYIVFLFSNQLGDVLTLLRLLFVSQFFVNISIISISMLERSLSYKKFFIAESISLFVTQTTIVALAFFHFGLSSFIIGTLLGRLVSAIVYFFLYPWRFGFAFKKSIIVNLAPFGISSQIGVIFGSINNAAMPLIVGTFSTGSIRSSEAVGLVSFAIGVSMISTAVGSVFENMLFPIMSRLQNKKVLAQKVFSKSLQIVAFFTIPTAISLFILAPEVIKFVYTPVWLKSLPSFRLALIHTSIATLTVLSLSSLLAFGEANFFRNMQLLFILIQWSLGIPAVMFFGFWGFNVVQVLVSLVSILSFMRLRKYFEISYWHIFAMPIFSGLAVAGSISIMKNIFIITSLIQLLIVLFIGFIVMIFLQFVIFRKQVLLDLKTIIYTYSKIISSKTQRKK